MKTRSSRWLLAGATLLLAGASFAQPGGGFGGGPGGQGGPGGGWGGFGNMTPEQRQQAMQQRRENQLKRALSQIGEPSATQDAVLAFVRQQNDAAKALAPKIDAVRRAFGDRNATDATIKAALADYRSAVADARTTRQTQTDALDKQISFSTKPKLEALLTMLGVIGDETGFVATLSGDARLPGAGGPGNGRGGRNRGGGNGGMNPGGPNNGGDNGGPGAGAPPPGGPPPGGDGGPGGEAPPPPPAD